MAFCPYCMTATDAPICPTCGKATNYTAKPWHLPAGTALSGQNRYRIGAALGNGGFGITYIGIESDTEHRVAIKEFFPARCAQRSGRNVVALPGWEEIYIGGRKSFLAEGEMLRKVQNVPSAVRVRDCFEANNTAYIVMEYLNGVTLESKVKHGSAIPVDELLPRLHALADDLAKLHAAGIVHRDIAPDNIMWMPDGKLKLLDFGAAKAMEAGKSMEVMLKHGFSPVEQYTRHGQGAWTDVYALCATVYYCLTGRVPPSAPDRLDNDTLVQPSRMGVKLTKEQEDALLWGLTVQPQIRARDMGELSQKFFPPEPPKPPVPEPPKPPVPEPTKPPAPEPPIPEPEPWYETTIGKILMWVAAALTVALVSELIAFTR